MTKKMKKLLCIVLAVFLAFSAISNNYYVIADGDETSEADKKEASGWFVDLSDAVGMAIRAFGDLFRDIISNGLKMYDPNSNATIDMDSIIYDDFKDTSLNFFADESERTTLVTNLRTSISDVYNVFQAVAIIVYLITFLYIVVRVLLATTGKGLEEQKRFFFSWVEGVILLFFMPYIMKYAIEINHGFVTIIGEARNDASLGLPAPGESLMGNLRKKIVYKDSARNTHYDVAKALVYLVAVFQFVVLVIAYYKRLFTVGFLIGVYPVVAMLYPIDKVNDGKAQSTSVWLKELLVNIFTQTIHAIIYLFVMAIATTSSDWILGLVGIAFLFKGEELLKQLLGGTGSSAPDLKSTAIKTSAALTAMSEITKKMEHGATQTKGTLKAYRKWRTESATARLMETSGSDGSGILPPSSTPVAQLPEGAGIQDFDASQRGNSQYMAMVRAVQALNGVGGEHSSEEIAEALRTVRANEGNTDQRIAGLRAQLTLKEDQRKKLYERQDEVTKAAASIGTDDPEKYGKDVEKISRDLEIHLQKDLPDLSDDTRRLISRAIRTNAYREAVSPSLSAGGRASASQRMFSSDGVKKEIQEGVKKANKFAETGSATATRETREALESGEGTETEGGTGAGTPRLSSIFSAEEEMLAGSDLDSVFTVGGNKKKRKKQMAKMTERYMLLMQHHSKYAKKLEGMSEKDRRRLAEALAAMDDIKNRLGSERAHDLADGEELPKYDIAQVAEYADTLREMGAESEDVEQLIKDQLGESSKGVQKRVDDLLVRFYSSSDIEQRLRRLQRELQRLENELNKLIESGDESEAAYTRKVELERLVLRCKEDELDLMEQIIQQRDSISSNVGRAKAQGQLVFDRDKAYRQAMYGKGAFIRDDGEMYEATPEEIESQMPNDGWTEADMTEGWPEGVNPEEWPDDVQSVWTSYLTDEEIDERIAERLEDYRRRYGTSELAPGTPPPEPTYENISVSYQPTMEAIQRTNDPHVVVVNPVVGSRLDGVAHEVMVLKQNGYSVITRFNDTEIRSDDFENAEQIIERFDREYFASANANLISSAASEAGVSEDVVREYIRRRKEAQRRAGSDEDASDTESEDSGRGLDRIFDELDDALEALEGRRPTETRTEEPQEEREETEEREERESGGIRLSTRFIDTMRAPDKLSGSTGHDVKKAEKAYQEAIKRMIEREKEISKETASPEAVVQISNDSMAKMTEEDSVRVADRLDAAGIGLEDERANAVYEDIAMQRRRKVATVMRDSLAITEELDKKAEEDKINGLTLEEHERARDAYRKLFFEKLLGGTATTAGAISGAAVGGFIGGAMGIGLGSEDSMGKEFFTGAALGIGIGVAPAYRLANNDGTNVRDHDFRTEYRTIKVVNPYDGTITEVELDKNGILFAEPGLKYIGQDVVLSVTDPRLKDNSGVRYSIDLQLLEAAKKNRNSKERKAMERKNELYRSAMEIRRQQNNSGGNNA